MINHTENRSLKNKYPEAWEHLGVRCESMPRTQRKPVYDFVKRVFDIAASLAVLILLWWVFAIAAIAIKAEDGGPVIYSQIRVGKDGRLFKMYKFRSMCVDAESMKKELMKMDESEGPTFKLENDPRITKVGRILRKYSIDELPQVIHTLAGTMSIVGPRPPLGHEVMEYDEYAMRRLTVKPGLTCYWQCSGRSNLEFDEWMRLDNEYINDRGVWTDIKIIFKTIPAVFKHDGAY